MKLTGNVILRLLGILLLTAAILKGYQLLTEPVANNSIWTMRWFLIATVEIELFLGVWLVSGLFRKAAWLVGLACFGVFSVVTLYKAITGAASCGCFGSVHVNPWITLFAIDLPAVIALLIFRPRIILPFHPHNRLLHALRHVLTPQPSTRTLLATFLLIIALLSVTTTVLAINEPQKTTSTYEILEPETWIGKPLPILEHIDIGDSTP